MMPLLAVTSALAAVALDGARVAVVSDQTGLQVLDRESGALVRRLPVRDADALVLDGERVYVLEHGVIQTWEGDRLVAVVEWAGREKWPLGVRAAPGGLLLVFDGTAAAWLDPLSGAARPIEADFAWPLADLQVTGARVDAAGPRTAAGRTWPKLEIPAPAACRVVGDAAICPAEKGGACTSRLHPPTGEAVSVPGCEVVAAGASGAVLRSANGAVHLAADGRVLAQNAGHDAAVDAKGAAWTTTSRAKDRAEGLSSLDLTVVTGGVSKTYPLPRREGREVTVAAEGPGLLVAGDGGVQVLDPRTGVTRFWVPGLGKAVVEQGVGRIEGVEVSGRGWRDAVPRGPAAKPVPAVDSNSGGTAHTVRRADGTMWTLTRTGRARGVHGGLLLLTVPGALEAWSVESGKRVWSAPMEADEAAGVRVFEGIAYVTTRSPVTWRTVALATGRVIGSGTGNVTGAEAPLVFAEESRRVRVLEPDGREWASFVGFMKFVGWIPDVGAVLTTAETGGQRRVLLVTRAGVAWSRRYEGPILGARAGPGDTDATLVGGHVLLQHAGFLVALDAATGEVAWAHPVNGKVETVAIVE